MIYFQKEAFWKAIIYDIKIADLKGIDNRSRITKGKKYEESLLCALIGLRINWLIFKKHLLKKLFKV